MALAYAIPGNPLSGDGRYADFKGSGYATITVAGTRQRITTTKTPIAGVVIQPLVGNTSDMTFGDVAVVGAAGSSHIGLNIGKGDSVFIPIRDLSLIYYDGITNSDAFYYTCVR